MPLETVEHPSWDESLEILVIDRVLLTNMMLCCNYKSDHQPESCHLLALLSWAVLSSLVGYSLASAVETTDVVVYRSSHAAPDYSSQVSNSVAHV